MQVTEVRLKKREGDERFLASGSLTLDKSFSVLGIKVMKSKEGNLFVAFPSYRAANGDYKDVCFPITKDLREDITLAVLTEYEKL
ncbi:MAG: SpoVG family protein [Lachnospiraceae bacterium]|nr:SpoVG family protein [Lachnospiraceae bacterium]